MHWRKNLYRALESQQTLLARNIDRVIQFVIVSSVVNYCIATLPDIPTTILRWMILYELLVVMFFTVEYTLRFIARQPSWRYMFSFFGIIDFLSFAPFYFGLIYDIPALMALPMIRMVRLLKLFRYNRAIRQMMEAVALIRQELATFVAATFILWIAASIGIYEFERRAQPDVYQSVFDAMWWSVITLSTVGYGDMVPITPGGRMFTGIVLLLGLAVVAVPTGLLASALQRIHMQKQYEQTQARYPSESQIETSENKTEKSDEDGDQAL